MKKCMSVSVAQWVIAYRTAVRDLLLLDLGREVRIVQYVLDWWELSFYNISGRDDRILHIA